MTSELRCLCYYIKRYGGYCHNRIALRADDKTWTDINFYYIIFQSLLSERNIIIQIVDGFEEWANADSES